MPNLANKIMSLHEKEEILQLVCTTSCEINYKQSRKRRASLEENLHKVAQTLSTVKCNAIIYLQ